MKRGLTRSLLTATAVFALAACGGNDESSGGAAGNMSGTAAMGAPIIDGNVNLQCATGPAVTTTTSSSGTWTVALSTQTFPCLVSVTGGNLPAGQSMYSLALGAGNLNVTPLTSLIVASGFGTADPTSLGALPSLAEAEAALQAGEARVVALLAASGYTTPPADPLTAEFTATSGNAYDDFIHQLTRSLEDAGMTYTQMLTQAATGSITVSLPLTHVFTAAELAAMPQLNKASLSASGGELTMALQAGANTVGKFVGGGNGNKAVLQLPGLAGTKLKDLKSMSMDVKGDPTPGSRNVYPYVNFTVDLTCDGSALAANATLKDARTKRRLVIYDPYVKYVQGAAQPLNDAAFTTVKLDFATPGWRVSAGAPVGDVLVGSSYIGNETLEGFDFATYPNACIVDAASGDGGMFRDASADPACATVTGLPETAPATCGKSYRGAIVVVGDSATDVASSWKVKNIQLETTSIRTFAFQ